MVKREPRIMVEVWRMQKRNGQYVHGQRERYLTWSAEYDRRGVTLFQPKDGYNFTTDEVIPTAKFVHLIKLGPHDTAKQYAVNEFGLVTD